MYKVGNSKEFSRMLARLIRAWMRGQEVTVTYMKPEYDQPRVRTWHISDIFTSEDGDICVLAWDSYHDEVRTFHADRVTHYTRHRSTYSIAEVSDKVADKLQADDEGSEELADDENITIDDEWERAAAVAAGASDWFEARGLPHNAQRLWENAEFCWRMVMNPTGDSGAVRT